MSVKVSWRNLPIPPEHRDALTRSSNSLAVCCGRAFIFGGERKPRTPVDNVLYEIDLENGETSTHSDGPEPRVGAALVALESSNALILWAGRGGKAMTPLPGDIHRFDIDQKQWSSVSSTSQDDKPEDRSFHVMTADGDMIYMHAGCPAKGRSATLSSLRDGQWSSLPDAPAPARGGTVLALLHDGRLARFGGFAGYELGGPLVFYDPRSTSWSEATLAHGSPEPAARSVHGFVGLRKPLERNGKQVIAILLYGEAEPASPELGHDGAGNFHDNVWALLQEGDEYSWEQVPSSGGPSRRGWMGVAPWYKTDGSTAIVLQGGLNSQNERLGDGVWVLELQ